MRDIKLTNDCMGTSFSGNLSCAASTVTGGNVIDRLGCSLRHHAGAAELFTSAKIARGI
jgi:hypothetical protein